jgi:adenine nucleotide transporter 17
MKEAILDVIEREGVTGLYAGLHSSLWGTAATNGKLFSTCS